MSFSNSISGYVLRRIENRISKRQLYTRVHRNNSHNSLEAT
jgi:hypothetical protein